MHYLETHGPFKFYYHTSSIGTPVAELVARYNNEMYDLGFNCAQQFATPYQDAIWAEKDGEVVAFIHIGDNADMENRLRLSIHAAYVKPTYRKSYARNPSYDFNLYDRLFEVVCRYALHKGCTSIMSGTHIKNQPAQRAFKRQGRVCTGYSYEFKLVPDEPPALYDK